ncbi:DUF1365 domain-containing protein [Maricaulis sp.]|uniref:DUF1365 domain-containing protein n=1 Tax=Maricaulis sp. TaxID=1486257 RepID=UPI00260A40AA|nr:DUF1365 domain-containing protein [Maricaulis sp.]
MMPLPASIYTGEVGHTRLRPRHHALRYKMYSILVDIDGPDAKPKAGPLFSIGPFNAVSFAPRDHGRGDGELRGWVEEKLQAAGVGDTIGRIQLLTAPRTFGVNFNPLSVFFCHDRDDRLAGIIFEVNNFHSGRCAYAFRVDDPEARTLRFACSKAFFVSPFNPVDGEYNFRLDRDEDHYRLGIQLVRNNQIEMSAVHRAERQPLTSRSLLATKFRHPFNTLSIVGAILIEALKLRLKGLATHAPRRGTIDTQSRSL